MATEYKIDKDIPVVAFNGRRWSRWHKLVDQMKSGDSVLVKTRQESHAIYQQIRATKHNSATRKWGSGFRVWKLGKLYKQEAK